ncbi:MAG: 1,3-beta-galactosyl-N-acetylhexosamine phosphorylase [Clostridiales bacterium]|jgi:1,3-beta-galactosyl-N-acetylhexosamine phosphorylase|nr:1,3-beta-galactosyl-N-acetylhexosamine phosphorylase [Clostridiales bacterium]
MNIAEQDGQPGGRPAKDGQPGGLARGRGRLTIPTDVDVVPQTLELIERWGADAVRDADGTAFPDALRGIGAKIYATYYTTRRDNAWALANPDEVQQCYVMTGFHAAVGGPLQIPLMRGISRELMAPNDRDDIGRWWEVVDRTTGEALPAAAWRWDGGTGSVVIEEPAPFHEYTVSFLAYLMWDPVHMYNAVVNGWKDFERQMTFDARQPKTRAYSMERLRRYIKANPHVDVLRFTTFFHQFTLIFDELRREKYVDWYGYSASVSPYVLERFEREAGYPFRPEHIIDQGYHNNQYRVPSRQYLDFMAFQRREVAALAKEMVGIAHEHGKEAMMFLGDHWIGTEPYMDEFAGIGLDAVVGSVGNGATLRLLSDIRGVRYTEGRFLPYFFPDTFREGGNPVAEARANWLAARRAMLRSPVDRIGYGGYLKLACEFPDFLAYAEKTAREFRELYENARGGAPWCAKTVAILNCWGRQRSWGCHMVHHALYQKQNYSYAGVIEALSGAAFDVRFISFDDLLERGRVPEGIDVIINVGGADTAHTGGACWENPGVGAALRRFVHGGGGFIGVGQPSGHQHQGRFFQMSGVMGVEKETGFTLGFDKYNWEEKPHFITAEWPGASEWPGEAGGGALGSGAAEWPGAAGGGAEERVGATGNGAAEGLGAPECLGEPDGGEAEGPCAPDGGEAPDFGEGERGVYALEGADVLVQRGREVQLAANAYGGGRGVYISGLPYSFANARLLYRAILWAAGGEGGLERWFSTNCRTEANAYRRKDGGWLYCAVNNTDRPQRTTVYRGDGSSFELALGPEEIRWYGGHGGEEQPSNSREIGEELGEE